MNGPVASLNTAWFALIGVLWTGYFVLEGFDFGVGMLSLAIGRDEIDRRLCRNAIGPVWDGNEVWLIVAAGATFAAFPRLVRRHVQRLLPRAVHRAGRADRAGRQLRVPGQAGQRPLAGRLGLAPWPWAACVPAFAWGVAFTDLVHGLRLSPPASTWGASGACWPRWRSSAGWPAWRCSSPTAPRSWRSRPPGRWPNGPAQGRDVALAAGRRAGGRHRCVARRRRLRHGPGDLPGAVPHRPGRRRAGWPSSSSGALVWLRRDGLAFGLSALGIVAACAAVFTALFPRVMVSSGPGPSLTIWSAASANLTLVVMTVVAAIFVPFVLLTRAGATGCSGSG